MPEYINTLWNNYKYCIVYGFDRIFFDNSQGKLHYEAEQSSHQTRNKHTYI